MYELKLNFKPLLKQLEIYTKKEAQGSLSGSYLSRIKGRGLEFDSFRQYTSADDASRIDWKASIRAQELLIKEFMEERNVEVIFLLDVSSSMCYGSIEKSKSEYAAELIAALTFAILRAGDSVGLVMFTDKIVKEIPANSGSKQYYIVLKALSNPNFYEGNFDLNSVITNVVRKLRKGAVVIVVSDFIGLKSEWENLVRLASKKFDFIGIMIRDPLDNEMPFGIGPVVISDPYSNEEIAFDGDRIKDNYSKINIDTIKALHNTFIRSGGGFLQLTTNSPFTNQITIFFKERKRLK